MFHRSFAIIMRKFVNKLRSVSILPPDCPLSMRVYRREPWYMALVNFTPSAYPAFIDAMEQLTRLERVTNYPETDMGMLQFRADSALPVAALSDLLVKTAASNKISITHYPAHHDQD